jgi:hypothetical protein
MIIEILKPYGKWQKGDTPDVTRSYGMSLVDAKIAKIHDDQTRRDYTPKVEEEKQTMTVNNYYVIADNEVLEIEADERAAYTNTEPQPEPKPKKKEFLQF